METGPWPHLDRRQERGVVWGGRHRFLLEVPANFGELRYGEVRRTLLLDTSLNRVLRGARSSSACHHGGTTGRSFRHAERSVRERRVEDAELQCRAGDRPDHRGLPRREPAARLQVDGELQGREGRAPTWCGRLP